MTISTIALGLAVILSVVYTLLAMTAYSHVVTEKRVKLSGLLALTLWWPFYDIYDSKAQRLRFYGKALLPITAAAYVAWGLSKVGVM